MSSIPWSTSGGWPSQSSTSPTTRSGWRERYDCVMLPGNRLLVTLGSSSNGTEGLDHVDVAALVAAGERGGQLRAPHGRLHQPGEVDVVGDPALLEVGALTGDELVADLEHGLRAVEERATHVVVPIERHRHPHGVGVSPVRRAHPTATLR